MYPTAKNIVLGAGHLFFDELDVNGNLTGETYIAETSNFAMNVSAESLEAWSDDGAIAEKLLDQPTRVTRDGTFNAKSIDDALLNLFFIATKTTQSTTAGAKAATAINAGNGVKQGRWYQLGVSASLPAGVRGIENVVIKEGVTAQTLDTDYKLDAATGRIYIVIGGGIADDTVLTADYDETTTSWSELATNDNGAAQGALRFVSDNTAGENRDYYFTKVTLKPDGEYSLKSREDVQQVGFAFAALNPGDGRAALYIDGRAA